jgi:hypothetical protein
MSLAIYKPNSKNTGCGFSFQCGRDVKSNGTSLYIKSIQQHSWDSSKRQGSFQKNVGDPDKNITVKFNEYEIGEFISALRRRKEYVTFHSFGDDSTIIKLVPWDKKMKDSTETSPCFGLSFTKNGSQSFKISLEPGEIECLIELFKFILQKSYSSKFETQFKQKAQPTTEEEAPF